MTGCFLAATPDDPLDAAVAALAAYGVAGEDAAREGKGPGSVHVALYDALAALDPARSTRGRGSREGARDRRGPRDRDAGRRGGRDGRAAARQGADRRGGRARASGFRALAATFVVNDDVDAALALAADGVHLGQGDAGAERARAAGLLLGRSAATLEQALAADADYLGVGPIWETPSKADADPAIGRRGSARDLCRGRRSRWSPSAASTPRTRQNASAPGLPVLPSSARRPTRR